MIRILLVTDKNKFFGQTRKPWVSLNTDLFVKYLSDKGVSAEFFEFDELVNNRDINGKIIFYHFSQKENLRSFINDSAEHLVRSGNVLIPDLELLRCHENKGYQELLKKRCGISDLNSLYLSSIEKVENFPIQFPCILKTVDGSNGNGVFLCNSQNDIIRKLNKYSKISLMEKVDLFRRKHLRRKKVFTDYPEYSNLQDYYSYRDYIVPRKRFILQEFVPNQEYDFRVTVIHNRFFVMKRYNRAGDFRASGSKLFDFNFDVDINLLNKAKVTKEKLPISPFMSMDFIHDKRDNEYKLIEFQALHFGISSILKNRGYYFQENENWEFTDRKTTVEEQFAYGLSQFLKEHV